MPKISVFLGDITTSTDDAIVNAANPALLGGSGVDGAIHRVAGPALRQYCAQQVPELSPGNRCPPGHVVVTPGFGLPAKYVYHTVGPIYPAGRLPAFSGESISTKEEADKILEQCLRQALTIAENNGIKSISFPAISCGIYGCDISTFTRLAQKVVTSKPWALEEINFVLFFPADLREFLSLWYPDNFLAN